MQSGSSFNPRSLLKCQVLSTQIKAQHSRIPYSVFLQFRYNRWVKTHRPRVKLRTPSYTVKSFQTDDWANKPHPACCGEGRGRKLVCLELHGWQVSHGLCFSKHSLSILKCYAIDKTIHFIPGYITLMRIKSFVCTYCQYILKGPKFNK